MVANITITIILINTRLLDQTQMVAVISIISIIIIIITITVIFINTRLLDQTKMGLSGYDPSMDDMRGIFLAQGPGKTKTKTKILSQKTKCKTKDKDKYG